jgi:hypothetical protein
MSFQRVRILSFIPNACILVRRIDWKSQIKMNQLEVENVTNYASLTNPEGFAVRICRKLSY